MSDKVSDFFSSESTKTAGLGMLFGFSAGYAVKNIGRAVVYGAGIGFICYEVARRYELVEGVDWLEVNRQFIETYKENEQFTSQTAQQALQNVGNKLGIDATGTTSFIGGFLFGLWLG